MAELAATLAAKPPATMKLGRDAFYGSWDLAADEAFRMLHPLLTVTASTEEAAEGIAAFTEKRPPSWRPDPVLSAQIDRRCRSVHSEAPPEVLRARERVAGRSRTQNGSSSGGSGSAWTMASSCTARVRAM